MHRHAVAPDGRVLLDGEAIERTLSRIAHEIIERNDDLDAVALVGIHTRGVPLAQRLRRLVADRARVELALGQLDITFHRDDVHVRGGRSPRRAQPIVHDTKLEFELEGRTVILVDDVWFARFFPSVPEIERRRFPSEAALEAELAAAGFGSPRIEALRQHRSISRDQALDIIRSRAFSTVDLLDPEEYDAGLARAEAELGDRLDYHFDWLLAVCVR